MNRMRCEQVQPKPVELKLLKRDATKNGGYALATPEEDIYHDLDKMPTR